MKEKDTSRFPRMVAAYDEEGVCIGVGESVHDLARQLHIDPSTVSKGCKRKKYYAYIMSDEELEQYERGERKRVAREAQKACGNA